MPWRGLPIRILYRRKEHPRKQTYNGNIIDNTISGHIVMIYFQNVENLDFFIAIIMYLIINISIAQLFWGSTTSNLYLHSAHSISPSI